MSISSQLHKPIFYKIQAASTGNIQEEKPETYQQVCSFKKQIAIGHWVIILFQAGKVNPKTKPRIIIQYKQYTHICSHLMKKVFKGLTTCSLLFMVNFYHPLPLLHSSPFTAGACRDVEAGAGERGGPSAMERRPIHLGKWEIRPAMGRFPRILTVIPDNWPRLMVCLGVFHHPWTMGSFRRCFCGWNGIILQQMNSLTLKIDTNRPCLFKITLLRVIPTMTFIHVATGKSSGILSGILSGIASGILPGISSGRCSGISSGIPSGILSGISSGILPGISSGVCSGISSGIPSGILSGISSGILSGKSSRILSGKRSGTLSGIPSGILSDISHGILSGISSGILSDILYGISSGILSGRWGPAVHTELGRSQVEVQRCPLSWEGPRSRSSGAHWAGKVPGWGPSVHTELGRWRRAWRRVGKATVDVEVEAEVVEEMLAEEEQEEQEEDS